MVERTGPGGEATPSPPLLELAGLTKRFGRLVACDRVDLPVAAGEIHGLLGQNGAGKSTLMHMIVGLVPPDGGEIRLRGATVRIRDPADARRHRIGMVHQHFSLVDDLTVWENVALGGTGRLDRWQWCLLVERTAARHGLQVEPAARVAELTAGEWQRVEILKCLVHAPDLVILDEPTSVLTPTESATLSGVLRRLVGDGDRAVVLISHKLDEILATTDRVSVLRDGRLTTTLATREVDTATLAQEMLGRDVPLHWSLRTTAGAVPVPAPPARTPTPPALEIRAAAVRGRDGRRLLDGVSLAVGAGEVVGVAGVEGNGQRALVDLLSSQVRLDAGRVLVGGREVRSGVPGAMARAGVAVVSDERHRDGCVLDMSIVDNLVLADLAACTRHGLLRRHEMRRRAETLAGEVGLAVPSLDAPLRSLSGGNRQRVVLARELAGGAPVVVAAQPMHGLDVAGIELTARRLRAAAAAGGAVLLISSDLGELTTLSDRIAVIHRGRIVGTVGRSDYDTERLGLLMGGQAA